jgi:hypothetical protein
MSRLQYGNKTKQKPTLFRYSIEGEIKKIADAFSAIADLSETSPDEVRAKAQAYTSLRQSTEWESAKSAADLWTSAFFAPLTKVGRNAVPTTRCVWDAISGRLPSGQIAATTIEIAATLPVFHWPLEFPDVLSRGGFDIILGNPPWDVVQFSDEEFFTVRAPEIAHLKGNRRKQAIASLEQTHPDLWHQYRSEVQKIKGLSKFIKASSRYNLAAHGKSNTASLFVETCLGLTSASGRSGLITPVGLLSDDTNKYLFQSLTKNGRLASAVSFENEEFIFPGIANVVRFTLLTILGVQTKKPNANYAFYLRRIDQLGETERFLSLSPEEFELFNPNTLTCPIFRTVGDATLTKKIYQNVPVLIRQNGDAETNPWSVLIQQNFFSHTTDSSQFLTSEQIIRRMGVRELGIWRTPDGKTVWLPLYEAKFTWQYDHRFGSYHLYGKAKGRGGRGLPPVTALEYANPDFRVEPQYWINASEIETRLASIQWQRQWLIGFRRVTNSKVERTVVATIIPKSGTDDSFTLLLPRVESVPLVCCLVANLNSLPFDYVARQKVGGTDLRRNTLIQLPVLPPDRYSSMDKTFVRERVLELIYTAADLQPFAKDLDYGGTPYKWNPDRRANLRAELDAYYGYLYGLTRRELEYILDPRTVMGENYPSETFRVLRQNEVNEFGEYRTQRLVLEAWDRFVANGTFDPARLLEPQYIDRVAQELAATRARLEQVEQDSKALLRLASATTKPTLFVEGVTDAKIVEAAWGVFFPNEPMPVKIIAAGGTKEMGSLAGKGKALREVLGQQVVLVLADNDSAGRQLTEDGHVRKGGTWRQLPNGTHWCLLRPTAAFTAAMKAHNVPADYWPFTIEAAFSPALRRQAEAAGAWRFSGTPQAELLDNPDLARRLFTVVPKLGPDDDACWYLMAPHPEAKETFAAWVTAPKQRTEENLAAFEEILRGLRALLARDDSAEAGARIRGAA